MGDKDIKNSKKQWSDMSDKEKKSAKQGFVIIAVIIFVIIGSASNGSKSTEVNGSNSKTDTTVKVENKSTESTSTQTPAATEVKKPSVPAEYTSALKQAGTYANTMHMSKKGLYAQLVSEYGGQFTAEAAQYAVDNVVSDWNANALSQAKTYQNTMNMSPAAVRDQLVSEYGGQFTQEEADYAVLHLND